MNKPNLSWSRARRVISYKHVNSYKRALIGEVTRALYCPIVRYLRNMALPIFYLHQIILISQKSNSPDLYPHSNDYNFKVIKIALSFILMMNPGVPSQCLSSLFNLSDESACLTFYERFSVLYFTVFANNCHTQGDSGSSLVCQEYSGAWRMVGVSSATIGGCADPEDPTINNYPDIYTRVSSYWEWINSVIDGGMCWGYKWSVHNITE